MNWGDLVADLDMLKCTSCGIFWLTLDITSTCDNCKTLKGVQCEQLFNFRTAFVPITPPASSSEVQIDRFSLDSPSPFAHTEYTILPTLSRARDLLSHEDTNTYIRPT